MASLLNTVSSLSLSNADISHHRRTLTVATPISICLSRRSFTVRATDTDANEVKARAPDKAPAGGGSSFNQILGIKGAKQETDKWKTRVQLTKPVTWPPLVWGVVFGLLLLGTSTGIWRTLPNQLSA